MSFQHTDFFYSVPKYKNMSREQLLQSYQNLCSIPYDATRKDFNEFLELTLDKDGKPFIDSNSVFLNQVVNNHQKVVDNYIIDCILNNEPIIQSNTLLFCDYSYSMRDGNCKKSYSTMEELCNHKQLNYGDTKIYSIFKNLSKGTKFGENPIKIPNPNIYLYNISIVPWINETVILPDHNTLTANCMFLMVLLGFKGIILITDGESNEDALKISELESFDGEKFIKKDIYGLPKFANFLKSKNVVVCPIHLEGNDITDKTKQEEFNHIMEEIKIIGADWELAKNCLFKYSSKGYLPNLIKIHLIHLILAIITGGVVSTSTKGKKNGLTDSQIHDQMGQFAGRVVDAIYTAFITCESRKNIANTIEKQKAIPFFNLARL